MKTVLYNQKAEKIGEVELNSEIFEVKTKQHLLAEAVRIFLANARAGTSNTKTRGEVRGGGKKPWKQKGTGNARAGSTRSPIWRHGGITFGPRANRNWELKLNKKAKTRALFMSLSEKAKDNKLLVVDSLILENPKTKEFAALVENFHKSLGDVGKKLMFLMPKKDDRLFRASRNLPQVSPQLASRLNLYEVLNSDAILMLKDSLQVIEKTYLKNSKVKSQNAK